MKLALAVFGAVGVVVFIAYSVGVALKNFFESEPSDQLIIYGIILAVIFVNVMAYAY